MELKYGVISADDHVCEHAEVWTERMSKQKWGSRVPHVEAQADGSQRWVVDDRPIEPSGAGFSEAALAAQSPNERLRAMDKDGIDYSVLYPSASGMSGEWFGRLDDIELETASVQAYNDWLIEEWVNQSPRFVAQCIVPLWPMDRTVAEIRRAVKLGHKGVIYPASPMELKNVPHINEPDYDPLWAVCQELNVPLCFHSGASPRIQMRPDENFSPATARAFRGIVRSVSSIAVLANFLFSKVLYRFSDLRVVFAESSLGWAAYEMEYADYQSAADGLGQEGYSLKPSELFQRQCYFTCWYDRESLRVRRYVGSGNILWSTNFPLKTSTWPETRQHLDSALGGMPENEQRQIRWENAAKLYSL
jgi:predicted TIM-barrel fold metal-dependent hydrolase